MTRLLCLLGRHEGVTLWHRVHDPAHDGRWTWDEIEACSRCTINQEPGVAYLTFGQLARLTGYDRVWKDLIRNR